MHEFIPIFGTSALGTLAGARLWVAWRLGRRSAALQFGDRLPDFQAMRAADGKRYCRSDFKTGKPTVLIFMSNSCPGVKAYDGRLAALQERYAAAGVVFIGINPVDPYLYPSESLKEMRRAAKERKMRFVYLKDETQFLARAFGAVCTPQVFLLDKRGRLRYRGRIDDAFVPSRVSRNYLEDALDDLLEGLEVEVPETRPLGCAIEWAPLPEGAGRLAAARRFVSRGAL